MRLLAGRTDRLGPVLVLLAACRPIARESVGNHDRAGLHVGEHELPQRRPGDVLDHLQSAAAERATVPLDGHLDRSPSPAHRGHGRRAQDRQGTSHRPPRTLGAGRGQDAPSPCETGAASPMPSAQSRSPASASAPAPRFPASGSPSATPQRTTPSAASASRGRSSPPSPTPAARRLRTTTARLAASTPSSPDTADSETHPAIAASRDSQGRQRRSGTTLATRHTSPDSRPPPSASRETPSQSTALRWRTHNAQSPPPAPASAAETT